MSFIEILEEIVPAIYDSDLTFKQDNVPIHVSNASKSWFENNAVKLLEWPPYSPDLNPIENLWFPLKAGVYKENPNIKAAWGGADQVRMVLFAAAEL